MAAGDPGEQMGLCRDVAAPNTQHGALENSLTQQTKGRSPASLPCSLAELPQCFWKAGPRLRELRRGPSCAPG